MEIEAKSLVMAPPSISQRDNTKLASPLETTQCRERPSKWMGPQRGVDQLLQQVLEQRTQTFARIWSQQGGLCSSQRKGNTVNRTYPPPQKPNKLGLLRTSLQIWTPHRERGQRGRRGQRPQRGQRGDRGERGRRGRRGQRGQRKSLLRAAQMMQKHTASLVGWKRANRIRPVPKEGR